MKNKRNKQCEVSGCTKKLHSKRHCLTHFSFTPSQIVDAESKNSCPKWGGRPSDYQEAARRDLVEDGFTILPWSWISTTCGEDMCMDTRHMVILEPQKLLYPVALCIYCGERAQHRDHLLPRAWSGDTLRRQILTVPSCADCNVRLNDSLTWSITQRRALAHSRIYKKHKKLLEMPEWKPEDLDGLEGTLRTYVKSELQRKELVLRRLSFPEDPSFDFRYLSKSGIDDPYGIGLIDSETGID